MTIYLDKIHSTPMLEDSKNATKEQLLLSHLRMVDSIVTKFFGKTHALYDDLVQVGNMALMKSVEGFDPSIGVSFASYAIPWIKLAIMNYSIDNRHDIRVLTTKPIRKAYFNQRKYQRADGTIDRERMSNETGVSVEDIYEMEKRTHSSYVAFELQTDDGGWEDVVIVDHDSDPANVLQNLQYEDFLKSDMLEAQSVLNDRERFIIQNRFNVDEPMILKDIAAIFGISIERVRQLEKAALAKLKKVLAEKFETV